MVTRKPRRGIPPALTASGPSMARSHDASTDYWLQRGRQSTQRTQGTPVARPDMGPQGKRMGGIRRRRGTKPRSARSLCAAITESETREGDPPNGCARLTRAAVKGGKKGGDPTPSSACPRCAAGARGDPRTRQRRNPPRSRDQEEEAPPPSTQAARTTRTRAGGGGGHPMQGACSHHMQPKDRGRGGPPQTAACAPSTWHARQGRGRELKPGGQGRVTPQAAYAPSAWHVRKGGGANPEEAIGGPPDQWRAQCMEF